MGRMKARKPKSDLTRPVTLADLESLVRALGKVVRESVADEVRQALRDVAGVETANAPAVGALRDHLMMEEAYRPPELSNDFLRPGDTVPAQRPTR